jgi:uncharacterized membrane protein HdeD (DUF308 family)
VPEPVRVALRLLGLVLLIAGVACLVLLVQPGPHAIAEAMGVGCATSRMGPAEQCSWWNAAELLLTGFVGCVITGFVLRMITRRKGSGPITINLGRRPPR